MRDIDSRSYIDKLNQNESKVTHFGCLILFQKESELVSSIILNRKKCSCPMSQDVKITDSSYMYLVQEKKWGWKISHECINIWCGIGSKNKRNFHCVGCFRWQKTGFILIGLLKWILLMLYLDFFLFLYITLSKSKLHQLLLQCVPIIALIWNRYTYSCWICYLCVSFWGIYFKPRYEEG